MAAGDAGVYVSAAALPVLSIGGSGTIATTTTTTTTTSSVTCSLLAGPQAAATGLGSVFEVATATAPAPAPSTSLSGLPRALTQQQQPPSPTPTRAPTPSTTQQTTPTDATATLVLPYTVAQELMAADGTVEYGIGLAYMPAAGPALTQILGSALSASNNTVSIVGDLVTLYWLSSCAAAAAGVGGGSAPALQPDAASGSYVDLRIPALGFDPRRVAACLAWNSTAATAAASAVSSSSTGGGASLDPGQDLVFMESLLPGVSTLAEGSPLSQQAQPSTAAVYDTATGTATCRVGAMGSYVLVQGALLRGQEQLAAAPPPPISGRQEVGSAQGDGGMSPRTAAILGGVLGGAAVLLGVAVAVAVVLVRRRRRRYRVYVTAYDEVTEWVE